MVIIIIIVIIIVICQTDKSLSDFSLFKINTFKYRTYLVIWFLIRTITKNNSVLWIFQAHNLVLYHNQ